MNKEVLSLFPIGSTINHDGHLVIGGCDAVMLAKQYGTPLYIIDEGHIRDKCREFKKEFVRLYQNVSVAYASKACLNKAVARLIAEEGLELDVVSG
ncbi:MAG: diaminopimelate decarboxylase, partial [Dehalococcoidales bacterium]